MKVVIPGNQQVKLKEGEKRDRFQDLARELKKTMEHEGDDDTSCNWFTRHSHERINKKDLKVRGREETI